MSDLNEWFGVSIKRTFVLHVLCQTMKIFFQYSIQKAAVMLRISYTWNSWVIGWGMWCGTSSKTFNIDDDDGYYRYILKSLLKAIGNGLSESMMVIRSHSLPYNG